MAHFTWKSQTEIETERQEQVLASLRAQRDRALRESDWTQLPDAPLGPSQKEEWAFYRMQLRGLPNQAADPATVRWPDKPGGGS